ncbi:hypothetical protein J1614_005670 [Plenodomus biglobosus]|nr:hypothetical protein J1614_005670 [Plenodomus biglobosus]
MTSWPEAGDAADAAVLTTGGRPLTCWGMAGNLQKRACGSFLVACCVVLCAVTPESGWPLIAATKQQNSPCLVVKPPVFAFVFCHSRHLPSPAPAPTFTVGACIAPDTGFSRHRFVTVC